MILTGRLTAGTRPSKILIRSTIYKKYAHLQHRAGLKRACMAGMGDRRFSEFLQINLIRLGGEGLMMPHASVTLGLFSLGFRV